MALARLLSLGSSGAEIVESNYYTYIEIAILLQLICTFIENLNSLKEFIIGWLFTLYMGINNIPHGPYSQVGLPHLRLYA